MNHAEHDLSERCVCCPNRCVCNRELRIEVRSELYVCDRAALFAVAIAS